MPVDFLTAEPRRNVGRSDGEPGPAQPRRYRRCILTRLIRGESRHGVARAVFHGQCDEVRQRDREGQEDQLGALGLVVNVVVLWNTLSMDAARGHRRRRGVKTKPEDVARLSPRGHENITARPF